MPKARAASSWSFGKFMRPARQISQLKAAVIKARVDTAAVHAPISMPSVGTAKKMSRQSVTAGVERNRLT